ncbi:MAG: peptidoglycan DD-metalloendopeptidase family protein [Bacteroidales bacterium]
MKLPFINRFARRMLITIVLLSFSLCVVPAKAQDKKELLENNKKKIEEEILYNSKLLEETKNSKSTTINQLVILKNQISQRERLIQAINEQVKIVNDQINLNNELLSELEKDLDNLKDEYAKMIYYAYKNRDSYSRLMFIFSSEDFNQAFRRLKYFQQYSAYRKTQVQLIVQTRQEINELLENLDDSKKEKLTLLSSLEKERAELNSEKIQQNQTYQNLTKKEKELLATIQEKEKAAKKLQKEIEKIIAEEIRLAANKSGTTETGTYALTPEELQLSADFTLNRGGLPWPLERGIISSTFGEHAHPVLKGVKTKNNGIDLLTEENANARAIFAGEVTRVMSIPNYNYVIMIRHGEFLSVYSNLAEVFVNKGDRVETKQKIGKIHTDSKELKTELHFELWQGKTILNPETWLAK